MQAFAARADHALFDAAHGLGMLPDLLPLPDGRNVAATHFATRYRQ